MEILKPQHIEKRHGVMVAISILPAGPELADFSVVPPANKSISQAENMNFGLINFDYAWEYSLSQQKQ